MNRIHILIFFLLSAAISLAQNKVVSADTIGALFNEKIEVYDVNGGKTSFKIPDKGHYFLVYRFKGFDPRRVETIDSVRLLENKISTILLGGMVDNLKIICLSYDKPADYSGWCERMKLNPPFKTNSKYTVEYYNLNGIEKSEKRCKDLFTKVTLFGPDGKFLSYSSSIARFRYHVKDDDILVKGKIVSEDNGIKQPLKDVDVHIESGNKYDTLAKGRTDQYGDFAVKIRNKDTAYTIKADPKDKNLKNVLLLTQEGKTISYLKKTFLAFEYKLLKADILELAELTADEDITLTFKKFDSGKDKQLLVVEDIIYAKDQYKVNAQAEEILNEVFDLLNKNVNVKLEIVSHTDAQGDDDANRKLSEKRAEAVAEYLIAKGISKSRITSKGKGETQIRNRCTNGINCSDKEHSYNRRTEFVFSK